MLTGARLANRDCLKAHCCVKSGAVWAASKVQSRAATLPHRERAPVPISCVKRGDAAPQNAGTAPKKTSSESGSKVTTPAALHTHTNNTSGPNRTHEAPTRTDEQRTAGRRRGRLCSRPTPKTQPCRWTRQARRYFDRRGGARPCGSFWRLGACPTKTCSCAARCESAAARRERAATSSGRNMKQKTLTRAAARDGARREAVHHRREAHCSRVRVKATGASTLRRVGCPSRASSRRRHRRPGARRLRDRLSVSWERRRSCRRGSAVQRRRRRFAPRRRVPVAAVVAVAADAGSSPMPLWTSQHGRGRWFAHTRPTLFLLPVSFFELQPPHARSSRRHSATPVAVGPDRDGVAVDRHGTATTRVEINQCVGCTR